jgi:hypothetical protein
MNVSEAVELRETYGVKGGWRSGGNNRCSQLA